MPEPPAADPRDPRWHFEARARVSEHHSYSLPAVAASNPAGSSRSTKAVDRQLPSPARRRGQRPSIRRGVLHSPVGVRTLSPQQKSEPSVPMEHAWRHPTESCRELGSAGTVTGAGTTRASPKPCTPSPISHQKRLPQHATAPSHDGDVDDAVQGGERGLDLRRLRPTWERPARRLRAPPAAAVGASSPCTPPAPPPRPASLNSAIRCRLADSLRPPLSPPFLSLAESLPRLNRPCRQLAKCRQGANSGPPEPWAQPF